MTDHYLMDCELMFFLFGERGHLFELIYKLTNSMIVYGRIMHHQLILM